MGAVRALLVVGLAVATWRLRSLLMWLFAAVIGAVAMDIPVSYILTHHVWLKREGAVCVVVLMCILTLWLLVIFVLPEFVFQAGELAVLGPRVFNAARVAGLSRLDQLETRLRDVPVSGSRFTDLRFAMQRQLEDPDLYYTLMRQLKPISITLLRGIGAHIATLMRCFLVCVGATMLCLMPDEHRNMVVRSVPAFYRQRVDEILGMCREALGSLLVGLVISALGVGLLTWVGLVLLGCPLALFSALLCGVSTFVPTVGPALGTLFPALVALASSGWLAWRVFLLGISVNYLLRPILKPQVMRRYVTILPTTALLAQAGFGLILGFPGAVLALPFVAVWQVILREAWQRDFMDSWLAPVPPRRRQYCRRRVRLPGARPGRLKARPAAGLLAELVGEG